MKSFLEYVAADLLAKYGPDMRGLTLVFPGRRASLFLLDALAGQGDTVWAPACTTIGDLFRSLSPLAVDDSIGLVCKLYRIYQQATGSDETLDHFYNWGNLMIADFDDIDKGLADAALVLGNVQELSEMRRGDYLTDEQLAALHEFFPSIADNPLLRTRFKLLASKLPEIYTAFRAMLRERGLAYEGMLFRDVAERAGSLAPGACGRLIFVGFNMLTKAERLLMRHCKREWQAKFYWDFDDWYMDKESGRGIRAYLEDFPNELDSRDGLLYSNFARPKEIVFLEASTRDIQARYIPQWLAAKGRKEAGRRTAIVLADEGLLPTAIHCLPPDAGAVNITGGMSLAATPADTLVRLVIDLHTEGYDRERDCFALGAVGRLLRHPWAKYISPLCGDLYRKLYGAYKVWRPTRDDLCIDPGLSLLFGPAGDGQSLPLAQKALDVAEWCARHAEPASGPQTGPMLFAVRGILVRLIALMESGDLAIAPPMLARLAHTAIAAATLPFQGEPVRGIQIMGMLETRCLDFDHLLVLCASEGNLPKTPGATSFVPRSVRKANGLDADDDKTAIQAYYFFRLLQRCADITLTYSKSAATTGASEMSRFMRQLMVESSHHIDFRALQMRGAIVQRTAEPAEKTDEAMEKLVARFKDSTITPSAINLYIRCPKQFHYHYVEGLREPDDTDEDDMDARVFGIIIHDTAESLYRSLAKDGPISAEALTAAAGDTRRLRAAVERAMTTALVGPDAPRGLPELSGMQAVARDAAIQYIQSLLRHDSRHAPIEIVGLECERKMPLTVKSPTHTFATTIGGRIDRLDIVEGHIRVVDYKTGNGRDIETEAKDIQSLFNTPNLSNHAGNFLQAILYAKVVEAGNPKLPVSTALLFLRRLGAADYNPVVKVGERLNDISRLDGQFMELVHSTLSDIFDQNKQFVPTPDIGKCAKCPYAKVCKG